jgi:2-succinyl-5-enolpyruvyl-6-hydroxy-3-cyclohexene-1-carboxylate synthase
MMNAFLDGLKHPFVVVSTLLRKDREAVVQFLLKLNCPVYLEAISGIREEPRLQHLRITYIKKLWDIDGVLRIGGVPTFRFWRDLEALNGKIPVLSISHLPFSGISWAEVIHTDISKHLNEWKGEYAPRFQERMENDRRIFKAVEELIREEPRAEQSLIHALSKQIPKGAMIYLGNSLPIREWDLTATYANRDYKIYASRGLNGIDGQISTFLGLCQPGQENWAILGDLTTLYDMAGPWILGQMPDVNVNIVVVNNGGGKIFAEVSPLKELQNLHSHNFEPLAQMWGLTYERWEHVVPISNTMKNRLIELCPDEQATIRYTKKYNQLWQFTHSMAS